MIELRSLPWLFSWRDRFLTAWQQGRAPQAILLAGPAGVGKRLLAHWIAQRWSCAAPPSAGVEPCGTCRSCQLAAAEVHPDRILLAPEAPQREIVIDQVRALSEAVRCSAHGERRVVIIAPAEAMNRFTANALLKLLEEPPQLLLFLLVSNTPGRLLPTIASRVQKWLIFPPETSESAAWLAQALAQTQVVTTAEQRQQALALTRGAPLAALALLTRGGAALIETFVRDASKTAWQDPLAVATRWSEMLKTAEKEGWRFADLLRWYRYWLSDLIRVALLHRALPTSKLTLHFPVAADALTAVAARLSIDAWWQRLAVANQLALWTEHPLNLQAQCEMVWLGYVQGDEANG